MPAQQTTQQTLNEEEEDVSVEERLKSALWLRVGHLVTSETLRLDLNATPQFIGALNELIWAQIEHLSLDLESFASHAKRSKILPADVMLMARRNEGLEEILKSVLPSSENEKEKDGERE